MTAHEELEKIEEAYHTGQISLEERNKLADDLVPELWDELLDKS